MTSNNLLNAVTFTDYSTSGEMCVKPSHKSLLSCRCSVRGADQSGVANTLVARRNEKQREICGTKGNTWNKTKCQGQWEM